MRATIPNRQLVVFLAVALGACTADKVTAPRGKLTGIYVLRSIDGAALPTPGNGSSMSEFTMIADTIRVFADGFGEETVVRALPGPGAIIKDDQVLQVWDRGSGKFDVEYPCPDYFTTTLASCIAPPHHRGVQSSTGMTLTYSVMYRVPLVYERVGDYIRPTANRVR